MLPSHSIVIKWHFFPYRTQTLYHSYEGMIQLVCSAGVAASMALAGGCSLGINANEE